MKEHLISFETAKLAHEKGYTRKAIGISFSSVKRNYYTEKGELNGDCVDFIRDVLKHGRDKARINHVLYPATSQSLLQQWLREKYELHIEVIPNNQLWHTVMYPLVCIDDVGHYGDYKTYEEALERGLQEALELI